MSLPRRSDALSLDGLGTRVRDARRQARLSQETLAALIGMDRRSLLWIEHGRTTNPGIVYIVRIAEACDVTVQSLIRARTPRGGYSDVSPDLSDT